MIKHVDEWWLTDCQCFLMIIQSRGIWARQIPSKHQHTICTNVLLLVGHVLTHMQSRSHMQSHTLAACVGVHTELHTHTHIPKHARGYEHRRDVGGRTVCAQLGKLSVRVFFSWSNIIQFNLLAVLFYLWDFPLYLYVVSIMLSTDLCLINLPSSMFARIWRNYVWTHMSSGNCLANTRPVVEHLHIICYTCKRRDIWNVHKHMQKHN